MKTNQVLIRKMGSFNVEQRTSDAMFNATNLLRQWNNENPSETRELDNFWKSTNLDKLMGEIAENELNFKSVDFTVLKNALSVTARGKYNGGTWMHPILYIKFAMYLSPKFEYHVLRFVSDQLLQLRSDTGDAYREMSNAIARIVSPRNLPIEIPRVSKAMNHIVFGKHESEIRNKQANEPNMRELYDLEKEIVNMITRGYIKTIDQLMSHLRMIWLEKRMPKVLTA